MRTEAARFIRFALVGVANTVLTLLVFAVLTHVGVAADTASGLAFAAGAANGYLFNRRWTFHAQGGAATLARYVGVQGAGAVLSAGGVALVTSDLDVRHLAAECLVIPVITLLTYTLSRRLVFADAIAVPSGGGPQDRAARIRP
jgi:putative flippase GtrA